MFTYDALCVSEHPGTSAQNMTAWDGDLPSKENCNSRVVLHVALLVVERQLVAFYWHVAVPVARTTGPAVPLKASIGSFDSCH